MLHMLSSISFSLMEAAKTSKCVVILIILLGKSDFMYMATPLLARRQSVLSDLYSL
jgi:hypothetical protein